MQADLLLYYVTSFCMHNYPWFPRCAVYSSHYAGIDVFQRMVSKKYFEKVKGLFKVATIEEFKELVANFIADRKNRPMSFSHWYHHLYMDRSLKEALDLERIGTID